MYYRLTISQEKDLLNQPETGMGYQAVEAHLPGSEMKAKFIVLNAELAVEMNEAAPFNVLEIATLGMTNALHKAMEFRWQIDAVLHQGSSLKPISVSNAVKTESPDGSEIFIRRSIYEKDKRIDVVNRRLLPGSYTTTLADALRHKSASEDPLIQLAMDHGVRGQWGYYLCPRRTDILQRGQTDIRTGAKEIFFKEGTSFGTFMKRETYVDTLPK